MKSLGADNVVDFTRGEDEAGSVREVVRRHLGKCEAMCSESLVDASGLEWPTLAAELESLEREGEVEILRPMFADSNRDRRRHTQGRANVHYRLVRPSDTDFLWEQHMTAQVPPKRIRDALQLEARVSSPLLQRGSRHRRS